MTAAGEGGLLFTEIILEQTKTSGPPPHLQDRVGAGGDSVRARGVLRPALVSLVQEVHYFLWGPGFNLGKPRNRRALRQHDANAGGEREEVDTIVVVPGSACVVRCVALTHVGF